MSFELSPGVDRDRVFLVQWSELEGRLDPTMALYQRKIAGFKYKAKSFSDLLVFKPQYGASEAGIDRKSHYEPRYIRITDIDEYGLLKNEIGKTAKVISPQYYLNNNDLLFVRSGATVGKAYIHKGKEVRYPCFYAGYMIRFVVDKRKVDPNYVFSYTQLSTYRNWVFAIQRAAGQPNINAAEYKALKIPVPPEEIQSQIVAKMDAAYVAKKQKEAEAQRLLDSIDDYLLGELGIELPEEEENTVESRVFIRRLSEVSGGRFDAPIHHKKYILLTNKYPMAKFGDCVSINPFTSFSKFTSETSATFIPMERVSDQYGEADALDCRKLAESTGYTRFQNNDLIWAKITPCMQNGKSAVVQELSNGIGFGSTEFHVFRGKSQIDIRYIYGLLRLRSLRNYAVLYFSGSAGHQRVSGIFFRDLNIPKPPLEKQTQIANHITEIRNRAKRLQQEAKAGLEQAKREVEAIILGEEVIKA
uniref:Type I restriction enzyme, S subunit n=1 Tax=Candidatus Kentrum sp. UNK TaxID=2126344 RepID=A0A451AZ41_9GAMM|nr:MAG: type I restriction enzyme, S subunit [Candidatus Kentron sp. UNK]VFK71315.1 MAG: type I restriction enzyme, S subunit [Candidatus Kentron sp. UNK]